MAQIVKSLPAMQDTQVWSLSWEDPLEKRMGTHSSILACRIPWTEEPGGLQSMGSQRIGHDWVANTFTLKNGPHQKNYLIFISKMGGNSAPLESKWEAETNQCKATCVAKLRARPGGRSLGRHLKPCPTNPSLAGLQMGQGRWSFPLR